MNKWVRPRGLIHPPSLCTHLFCYLVLLRFITFRFQNSDFISLFPWPDFFFLSYGNAKGPGSDNNNSHSFLRALSKNVPCVSLTLTTNQGAVICTLQMGKLRLSEIWRSLVIQVQIQTHVKKRAHPVSHTTIPSSPVYHQFIKEDK